ncbi:MAG: hypothetical protein MJ250_07275 [Alphaproteobacteria bacterium]|nr:hypothetical protein [Alphaproteobacteria bacterium]
MLNKSNIEKGLVRIVQIFCLTIMGIFLNGCVDPLYKTDPAIYQQYKYWETGQQNWREFGDFRILFFHDTYEGIHKLNMNTIKDGVPSREFGYLEAIRKVGFDLMEEICGSKEILALNSPANSTLDRLFYQDYKMTISVRFQCKNETFPMGAEFLQTEQEKWNMAERTWDEIDDTKAVIDVLPTRKNNLEQIKVRVFNNDENMNRKLARKWMRKICDGPFENLYIHPAVETLPIGKKPDIISKDNIYQYGFKCIGEHK